MKRALIALAMLAALPAAAQTVIFSCSFDGASLGGSGDTAFDKFNKCVNDYGLTSAIDQIHATLGPGVSGLGAVETASSNIAVNYSTTIPGNPRDITVVYYEKFSHWPIAGGSANSKSARPFRGAFDDNHAFYGTISAHFPTRFYAAYWQHGTAHTNPATVTRVSTGFCGGAGHDDGGEFGCPAGTNTYNTDPDVPSNPSPNGSSRFEVDWSVNGHNFSDLGFHKIRWYAKPPSSSGALDGFVELWIDEAIIYTIDGMGNWPSMTGAPTWSGIHFFPAEDPNGDTYSHSLDEITIYSGLVPPSGTSVCGNGIVEPGEGCDQGTGNQAGNTEPVQACVYGDDPADGLQQVCNGSCSGFTNCSSPQWCGDSVIQIAHEGCDLANIGTHTCAEFSCTGGAPTCNACAITSVGCTGCPGAPDLQGGDMAGVELP